MKLSATSLGHVRMNYSQTSFVDENSQMLDSRKAFLMGVVELLICPTTQFEAVDLEQYCKSLMVEMLFSPKSCDQRRKFFGPGQKIQIRLKDFLSDLWSESIESRLTGSNTHGRAWGGSATACNGVEGEAIQTKLREGAHIWFYVLHDIAPTRIETGDFWGESFFVKLARLFCCD